MRVRRCIVKYTLGVGDRFENIHLIEDRREGEDWC